MKSRRNQILFFSFQILSAVAMVRARVTAQSPSDIEVLQPALFPCIQDIEYVIIIWGTDPILELLLPITRGMLC